MYLSTEMLIMFQAQSFNGFLDFVVRLGFPGEQCPWSMPWGHRERGFFGSRWLDHGIINHRARYLTFSLASFQGSDLANQGKERGEEIKVGPKILKKQDWQVPTTTDTCPWACRPYGNHAHTVRGMHVISFSCKFSHTSSLLLLIRLFSICTSEEKPTLLRESQPLVNHFACSTHVFPGYN